jgi:predicted dehydrogenase
MEREVGIGVIGMGWMGRVHTAAYNRLPEHFPDLGVTPRLEVAADVSRDRRAHAERVGFARTTDDWRAVIDDPAVEVVNVTLPNVMHREVATAALEAGKHVWVEKPVGRGLEDTQAVAEAARRADGLVTGVGFCYRFAPAVRHARELIAQGAIGEVTHYRGVFLADYANRPDGAASWRFERAASGSGVLGDLMAHVVDLTHHLIGPIERLSGRTATMIPRRPRQTSEGTHFSRVESDDLVDVENEDWAAALVEFAGGRVGSLEASRVAVGPRTGLEVQILGSEGALTWNLQRMNELQRFQLSDDGDEGYTTIHTGPAHPGFAAFQPGAGVPMGYDDLRVLEARNFLSGVRDATQREPGVEEMLATARVLDAIERSAESSAWEDARSERAAVTGPPEAIR